MKFSEEILKQFNLEPENEYEPVNVMKISEMLDFMKTCSERIVRKSDRYNSTLDVEIQMDCIDIVTAKLNDFAQVFRDLLLFLRAEEGTYNGGESLRYCISSYDTFEFHQSDVEKLFLKELLLRNEITHDYFNRELHRQKLIWIMQNCAAGAIDVYRNLYEYCRSKDLLNKYSGKRT